MLSAFAYLGSQKAHEVVFDNPRLIAERIEKLE
jgi:DNA polymerase III alpha subunit (gram-positive type)